VIKRPSTPEAEKAGIKAARKILKAAGFDIPKDADVIAEAEKIASKNTERKAERKALNGAAKELIAIEMGQLTPEQQATAKLFMGDSAKPADQLAKLIEMKKTKMFAAPAAPPTPPAPPAGGAPPAPPPGGKAPVEPPARTAPTAPAPPAGGGSTPPDVKTEIKRIETAADDAVRRGLGRNMETKRNTLIAAVAKSENARALYKDDHSQTE
jgi:hypothetical protein